MQIFTVLPGFLAKFCAFYVDLAHIILVFTNLMFSRDTIFPEIKNRVTRSLTVDRNVVALIEDCEKFCD